MIYKLNYDIPIILVNQIIVIPCSTTMSYLSPFESL